MLVTFHFQVIVYQNFNLPQNFGQCPKKPHLLGENDQTLNMVCKHGSKYVELHVK